MKKSNTDWLTDDTIKHTMKKKSQSAVPKTSIKLLTLLITGLMANSMSQADTAGKNIGDLEIYQPATAGQINLMMMLDTSGSMGISSLVLPVDNKYGSPGDYVNRKDSAGNIIQSSSYCTLADIMEDGPIDEGGAATIYEYQYNITTPVSVTIDGESITYYKRGCKNPVNAKEVQYDRLSRLKEALITLLSQDGKISSNIIMGLGNFPAKTNISIGTTTNKLIDGHSGRILVEAKKLTPSHRKAIIKQLAALQSTDTSSNEQGKTLNPNTMRLSSTSVPDIFKSAGGTPTAHAYAEVAAAMMGTTTGINPNQPSSIPLIYDGYTILQHPRTRERIFLNCVIPSTETNTGVPGTKVQSCLSTWPRYDSSTGTFKTTDYEKRTTILAKPDGKDKWINLTVGDLKKEFNNGKRFNSDWEIYQKMPEGYRIGGWVKVKNEPLDIEPLLGLVRGTYATDGRNDIRGLVTYRSNPFAVNFQEVGDKYRPIDNNFGGIYYSVRDSRKAPDYTSYSRVATATNSTTAQCDSNGIYFLTDGAPNSTKDTMAQNLLNLTLRDDQYKINSRPTDGLTHVDLVAGMFDDETGGWEYIGEYAKRLRDASKNPSGVSIRTAVAGFGASFAGLKNDDDTYNCDAADATDDAKNACKWGQKGAGYGEGGFFYAQNADDISNSLVAFIASLNNTIPAAPSGTIAVPSDPFRTSGSLPYAYLPTVEAQLSGDNNTNLIWPGNLKKYNIKNGTLYGKNDKLLFSIDTITTTGTTSITTPTESLAGKLYPTTQDLWQTTTYQVNGADANDAALAGGVYENLKAPIANYDTRTVYVEDLTAAGATTTTLRKLSVDTTTGKPSGFDTLKDTEAYSRNNQIKILKFLGFSRGTYTPSRGVATVADLDSIPNDIAISNIVLTKPTDPIKVLGASIHSKPIAVSYGAELDATTGRLKEGTRKDYMLYGSMDGVLHLIKADDAPTGGKENIAIIPRVMMLNQADAIVPNAKYSITNARLAGVPDFGIDAPWILSAKYDYNYTSNKIVPNSEAGIYAYGGMRLGGKGLLGFKLPNDITAANPTITPAFSNKALIDNKTTGFGRLSYIFNQPTIAKMKTSDGDNTGTDVLVFGGGYDKCYENQYFQIGVIADTTNNIDSTCATKAEAEGNAIYIINAKTGDLLWSTTYDASARGATEGKKYMKNSIVAGVTVLDRDNDGFIDHLYAADLGGQVFRIDFKNGNVNTSSVNITRILADDQAGTSYARRFYERPNFSVYRENGVLFGLVNVISGDRSSPLSTLRTTDEQADRVYGILDRDITKANSVLYPATGAPAFVPTVKDLTVDSTGTTILNLWTAMGTMPSNGYTETQKNNVINQLASGTKKAWYYPLNRFDGHSGVKYSKGVGVSQVIDKTLYTSVYNPDMIYGEVKPCSATIKGGTERQMYCLPYGICNSTTNTSTGGFQRAGQGIQELNFGPVSSSNMTTSVMISTVPISYIVNPDKRINAGAGGYGLASTANSVGLNQSGFNATSDNRGDESGKISLTTERYVARPTNWFEN